MLFTALVFLAFLFWFLATFPVPQAERIARGLFLAAAIVWAISHV